MFVHDTDTERYLWYSNSKLYRQMGSPSLMPMSSSYWNTPASRSRLSNQLRLS